MTARPVSNWMRWGAVVWLAIWVPSYWHTWGAVNFLHLCDIAVLLTCIGLWTSNSLLLSSQAVGSMLSDAAWCLDAGWRLFLGKHLVGGTEYMWDANYSLFTRVLSLFHIVMPVILLVSLRQTGYDRRGWKLQAAITAVLMVASRFFNPALNLNYAFTDPVFHRAWGPVPIHLAAMFAGIVIVFYLPVHLVLDKVYPRPATTS